MAPYRARERFANGVQLAQNPKMLGRIFGCPRLPQPHARLISIEEFHAEVLKSALHISDGNGAAGNGARTAAFHVSDGVHCHFSGLGDGQLVDTY
jgi:hypothetical protein